MDYREVLKAQTVLDRKYRIDRVIGAGGFGITYQAFDLGLAAPVAIKEYYPAQFGMRDTTLSVRPRRDGDRPLFDRLRASFLREARTLAQFDHPAIVRVLSVFETHGTAYMVMRFESGDSFKVWLKQLGRAPRQTELDRILGPLLDAIELMHMADFLHRDIAPDNIIVRADGTPVLLDFGASRRVVTDMSGTLTGVVKQGYSPQEQYSSDTRSQGAWTDIYSLGATLYLAVTGRVPTEATARMLEDGMMPAVEGARGSYRPEFLAAIDASMRLRPRERPQTVAAWREMLFDGADPAWYSAGNALYEGGTGPGGLRVPASTPRSGPSGRSVPRGSSAPRLSAPRTGPSVRTGSQADPHSGPSARSSPRSGANAFADQPSSSGDGYPVSTPAGLSVPSSMATRATDFALSTRGAIVLGVVAMLLGGSMLLAFENPDPGGPPIATLDAPVSGPPSQNAGTPGGAGLEQAGQAAAAEVRRQEAARQAEVARQQQEQARIAAEAEARRQEAARQAEVARQQQEQARKAAEAEARRQEAVRQAEVARQQQEQARKAAEAEARRQEAIRQAEVARQQQEQARIAAEAEARRQEAIRQAEVARQQQEQARKTAEAEARQQEAIRQAEVARQQQEQARIAAEAEARRQEAIRQAEVARQQQEQARIAAEAEAAERQRIASAAAAIAAEDARRRQAQSPSADDQAIKDVPARSIVFADPARAAEQFARSLVAGDGAVLAGGASGAVRLWPTSGTALLDFPSAGDGAITSLSILEDGSRAVGGATDGTLHVWDVKKRTLLQTVQGNGSPVVALKFRSETRVVALFADGSWSIVQPESGDVLMSGTKPDVAGVTAGQFVGDGKSVFAAFADGTTFADGTGSNVIEAWVPSDGGVTRVSGRLTGHSARINAVAGSADGAMVASASDDGTVRLWAMDSASERHRLETSGAGAVRSLAFSATGALVAGARDDGTVDVWQTRDGQRIASYRGTAAGLQAAVFSSDGAGVVASGADGMIRQWALPAAFVIAPPPVVAKPRPEPAVVVVPRSRIERPEKEGRSETRRRRAKREAEPERRQVRQRREAAPRRSPSGGGGGGGSPVTVRVPSF